jgi:hypothetical protein
MEMQMSKKLLLALGLLSAFATTALADGVVDLSGTNCPDCAPQLLREPEQSGPITATPTDPVDQGIRQGIEDVEDYVNSRGDQ